jgi:hypothetical protein
MSKDFGKIGIKCDFCWKPLKCRKYPDAEEGIEQKENILCANCAAPHIEHLERMANQLQDQQEGHTISIDNSNSSSESEDNAYVFGKSASNEIINESNYQVNYEDITSKVMQSMLEVLEREFPHFIQANIKDPITEDEKINLYNFFVYCLGLKEMDTTDGEPAFDMTETQKKARDHAESVYEHKNLDFLEEAMDLANGTLTEYVEDTYDDSEEAQELEELSYDLIDEAYHKLRELYNKF